MTDVIQAAVALTTELVAVDSVNPGLVAGAAGEAEMVALLPDRLDRARFVAPWPRCSPAC